MTDPISRPLFGYQAHFIADWSASPHRRAALVWPAGAGAISTIWALLYQLPHHQRVLVVADRQELVQQFVYSQRDHEVSVCAVDGYRYRQMQSTLDANSSIWTESQVYVLTSSLASQSDVGSSLQRQPWDMLIFLDTTNAVTLRLVESFSTDATRVLWKLRPGADPLSLDTNIWMINHLTVRELSRDRGLPVSEAPYVLVRALTNEPTAQERSVANLIDKLITMTKGTSAERLTTSLHARWISSPAALESGLRRLEAEISMQWPLWDTLAEDSEGDLPPDIDSQNTGEPSAARRIVKECIGALDALPSDGKLENLLDYLRSRDSKQSTTIFVRYRDTGAYLFAALEDQGVRCISVNGAMPYAEVRLRMQRFLEEPGQVLIMTTAMLVGSDLSRVRNLVLYDAPASREVMSQLLAKFHLIGLPQLHVTVIADQWTAHRTADLIQQAGQFAA